MDYISLENILQLEFDLPSDDCQTLKTMANLAGFEISASDSPNSNFCLYFCSKGGRKRGKKPNKTNCSFFLTSCLDKNILIDKIIISTKNICLSHNHKLHPSIFHYKTIDDSVLAIIHQMYQSDIPPHKIRKCGGILYASILTEEVIVWMLRSLLELGFMKKTLETIITEEDAVFIVAFKQIFSCENDIINNIVNTSESKRDRLNR